MSKPIVRVVVPEQMNQDLERVKEETGLSKSEITRRGILEQIKKLDGDVNEG